MIFYAFWKWHIVNKINFTQFCKTVPSNCHRAVLDRSTDDCFIGRLNSECQDIKNIHDFFDFFEVFRIKTFLCSEMQSSGMHHKICHKIPHRTVHVASLWDVVGKRYHVFYRFNGGWKLRRFTQNQINLHQKVSQNHRIVIKSNEVNFHEKIPTHWENTHANMMMTFYGDHNVLLHYHHQKRCTIVTFYGIKTSFENHKLTIFVA